MKENEGEVGFTDGQKRDREHTATPVRTNRKGGPEIVDILRRRTLLGSNSNLFDPQLRESLGPGVSQLRVPSFTVSFSVDFGQKMFPVCSFTHLSPIQGSGPYRLSKLSAQGPVEVVPLWALGFRVFSMPSHPYCLVPHEAIPVQRCASRLGRFYTGEIDASTDRLSKSMIRARGPLPVSCSNDGQGAVLFRGAPENRFQLRGS